MIPLSLIELVNSSKLSFSKTFLGWYLFLIIELIEIKVLFSLTSLSPIREERPLPKPFFALKGLIMLHSPLVCLDLKILL